MSLQTRQVLPLLLLSMDIYTVQSIHFLLIVPHNVGQEGGVGGDRGVWVTHRVRLHSPINQMCVFLDRGRNPGAPADVPPGGWETVELWN